MEMYKRLNLSRNKKHYKDIINSAIEESEELLKSFPTVKMYKSIMEQLLDLREKLIYQNVHFSENDLYNRYNFGAIAVKNFNIEMDEYAQKLSDSFGGAFDYHAMPEK